MEIDAPLTLARWVHFASLMIVFGGSLFHVYAPALPSLRQAMLPALARVSISVEDDCPLIGAQKLHAGSQNTPGRDYLAVAALTQVACASVARLRDNE